MSVSKTQDSVLHVIYSVALSKLFHCLNQLGGNLKDILRFVVSNKSSPRCGVSSIMKGLGDI